MDRHASSIRRRIGASSPIPVAVVTVLLVLSVAACGGAGAGASADEASTRPSPESAAPSVATPEPTPDVLAALQERLAADELSIVAAFKGTYTTDEIRRSEGTYTRSGADFLFEQTTHLPSGGDQQMRVALVDGQVYVHVGDIWLASGSAPSRTGLASALSQLEYELAGSEKLADGEGYVLRAEDADLVPAMLALNLADGMTEDPSGSLELVVTPEGEVAVIRVDAEQVQMGTPLEMSVEFVVQERGAAIKLPAIEDPWELWTSEHFPYRIAHPAGWYAEYWEADADFGESDMIMSGVGHDVEVYYTPDVGAIYEPPVDAAAVTAGEWLTADEVNLSKTWGVPVETNEPITPGGLEGRLLTMHVEDENLGPQFHMYADIFRGPDAFELRWFSDPGNEEADKALFLQMLSTFGPTQ